MINSDLDALGGHILHWDCVNVREKQNHVVLKDLVSNNISKIYPHTRKEKVDRILEYIYKKQNKDGGSIELINDPFLWGNFFLKNQDDLVFYVEELARKSLLTYDKSSNRLRLTFEGLDYLESRDSAATNNKTKQQIAEFDIALSFAGEERYYVDQVAEILKGKGIKVFYDIYEQVDLWGKDLYQHLNDVYSNKSKFCVVFVSTNYARKLWTRHELKAAQARAFQDNKEYILPVRFDNTKLPGMNPTISYLEAGSISPSELSEMIYLKLNKSC